MSLYLLLSMSQTKLPSCGQPQSHQIRTPRQRRRGSSLLFSAENAHTLTICSQIFFARMKSHSLSPAAMMTASKPSYNHGTPFSRRRFNFIYQQVRWPPPSASGAKSSSRVRVVKRWSIAAIMSQRGVIAARRSSRGGENRS